MLLGEYKHSIDSKGRIIVPAKFRERLGENFIVTRGLDGCLSGYPADEWEKLENKLRKLPMAKREARKFTRFFYSAATECKVDKQGRVNIPQTLIDFAELEKDCYLIGVSSRIEIWSDKNWDQFTKEAEGSFEDIAEDMIDYGF